MSIGVVVPQNLNAETRDRIRDLVKMAAGIDEARGDAIVVQTIEQVGGDYVRAQDEPLATTETPPVAMAAIASAPSERGFRVFSLDARAAVAAAALAVLLAILLLVRRRTARSLSAEERGTLLREIKEALVDGDRVELEVAK